MAVTLNVDAVESLAKSWSRLDWDNLQIRIEEEVKAIGIRQDEGDEGKRLLLQESTSFRENTDKVLRKAAVPLIKAFQGEVDRLTVRSKAAESFVIDLCRSLTSLPDPSEYLNQLKSLILKSQRLKSCEEELCFLKSQIADLRDEYADLQNQELTVRTLREQVKKLETEAERNVQASLRDSEKRLRAEFDVIKKEMEEKQETLIDENKKLSATVTDLEISNREAKETVEGMRLKLDQKEAMEDEHLEIVSNDLEKAVHRAMEAEQEILRLREELSRISGNSSPYENSVGESALIRSKDNQIRKLLEENKALAGKLSKETEEARKRIDELTEELQRHSETVKRLEAQLQAQSDYDEIKKELRILRNVEFGEEITPSGDFADNGVVSAATATAEIHSGGHLKALDELLVEKNHKLQNENATLRMRNHETEEDETGGKAILEDETLQSVANSLGLIVGSCNDIWNSNAHWNKGESLVSTKESTISDADTGDMQRCATNLLNLLMCTAGSSNALLTSSECNYPPDEEAVSNNYNSHEVSRSPEEEKVVSELQACVNRNIRQLGMRPLNTAELARQCKRLMIAYNIGQRLFAKFVMNQSQGSLSELLSKPRHWNKLTDKGREAFRRIYGWVSDEKAVGLLCSLAPRRIQSTREAKIETPSPESLWDLGASVPPFSRYRSEEGCYTDEICNRKCQKTHDESIKARNGSGSCLTPQKTNSRWRHDDIPKEKIITIFQNELAKLKQQESSLEQAIASRPPCLSSAFFRSRDEKECLNSGSKNLDTASDLPFVSDLGLPSSASTSSVPPSVLNSSANEAASPSFTFRNRSTLAPITQEQLERYPVLDTDDIVRRVREYLCAHSISQRQFGEHVLGLSQGSVSDLLARPKPWLLLTQKGREPFIRMQLFLSEAGLSSEANCSVDEPKVKPGVSNQQEPMAEYASKTSSNSYSDYESRRAAIEGLLRMKDSAVEEDLQEKNMLKDESNKSVCIRVNSHDISKQNTQLNVAEIIRLVKERLQIYGFSQKVFGELVLGLDPSEVSRVLELSNECDLSLRDRETFSKMQEWLDYSEVPRSPQNFTKSSLENSSVANVFPGAELSNAKTILQKKRPTDEGHVSLEPPRKSQRTIITEQQKEALKFVFAHDHHPSQRTVEQLSEKLSLNPRTVSNWFHNYRTRQKAGLKEGKILKAGTFKKCWLGYDDTWEKELSKLLEIGSTSVTVNKSLPKLTGRMLTKLASTESVKKCNEENQLERTVAAMRLIVSSKEKRLAEVEGVKNENAAEVIRLQQLVTQLENDLLSMNSLQSLPNSSKGRLDDGIVDEKVSAASLLASELSETEKSSKVEATGNILAIVTAQRNRLKLRVKELEKETIDEKEHSAFLQSELDKAHHDNVQLYGKIKFLQNYQSRQQNKNDIRMEMNDAETRYRNEYEMHIDPFKKFNALERQRKYGQLKPYDKAALQLGRWMMSSGHSRAIFLIYLLFLHLLVFLVLYRFAYTESCQRDFRTDCIAKFRSHMHRYHPGSPDEVS